MHGNCSGQKSKVEVTRSRDVSADKNALTRQWMVISTSNLAGIIYVGVDACGIFSRSVDQSRIMADIQHIKCKNQRITSPAFTVACVISYLFHELSCTDT